jgi:hypothetical protein
MTGWYALAFKYPSPRKVAAYRAGELSRDADVLVDAAVDILRNEREMPNDTTALKRVSAHHAAFAKMVGKSREECREQFIAAIVERATREYIQARRDSEDMMLVGVLA